MNDPEFFPEGNFDHRAVIDHFKQMSASDFMEAIAEDPSVIDLWKRAFEGMDTEVAWCVDNLTDATVERDIAVESLQEIEGSLSESYDDGHVEFSLRSARAALAKIAGEESP